MSYPILNFPVCRFRMTMRGGQMHIWDPLRGKWLRCTPEEWVRRHVIGWLTEHRGVVAQHVVQEYAVNMEGMAQRADVVVVGADGEVQLLVECKAVGVGIGDDVLRQAVRYNSVVGARFIMLTNGLSHFFYEKVVFEQKTSYNEITSLSANWPFC